MAEQTKAQEEAPVAQAPTESADEAKTLTNEQKKAVEKATIKNGVNKDVVQMHLKDSKVTVEVPPRSVGRWIGKGYQIGAAKQ